MRMDTREQVLLFAQFESEILDLIDDRDEFTRSDLQGLVAVKVRNIYQAGAQSELE
jgi:hypothetical protein